MWGSYETAMSPSPCKVTMTELIMSGTDVPAAKIVRPMTDCGMPRLSPITIAIHTCVCHFAFVSFWGLFVRFDAHLIYGNVPGLFMNCCTVVKEAHRPDSSK